MRGSLLGSLLGCFAGGLSSRAVGEIATEVAAVRGQKGAQQLAAADHPVEDLIETRLAFERVFPSSIQAAAEISSVNDANGVACEALERGQARPHATVVLRTDPSPASWRRVSSLMANHGDKHVMVQPALSGTGCATHEAVYSALLDDSRYGHASGDAVLREPSAFREGQSNIAQPESEVEEYQNRNMGAVIFALGDLKVRTKENGQPTDEYGDTMRVFKPSQFIDL